ncbi:MAG TPA: four helix bundle protein [Candidatus Binatia bacterium]|nr:four helix bundle protein [Candidatus Binatia bacterium]
MQPAKSFRDLKVYQGARESARLVFEHSRSFPHEERYSLTDQIRRSSRAVKAMIAEAWARRRYKAAFVNKIDEALEEAYETQSWLDDAFDGEYLSKEVFNELDKRYDAIGGMLSRMIDRADDFCKHAPSTDYRSIVREEDESPFTDH